MNDCIKQDLERLIHCEHSNIAGIAALKNGEMVYEKYFNDGGASLPVHIFSVTKSIMSLLLGIAIDKGFIKSTDQRIVDFFPDHKFDSDNKTISDITLFNLITMTAPYKHSRDEQKSYEEYFSCDDWVGASLDFLGGNDPIGKFRYAPLIGPDILSGIIAGATGQRVIDFAKQYLFEPLKIDVGENIIFMSAEEQFAFYKAHSVKGWVAAPNGINTAGWGLSLTTPDMAKIGLLCLNQGIWNGKQLVSQDWIKLSTSEHSRLGKLKYGYLWWIADGDSRCYAAMGDGGNIIYVNEAQNIVIAISAFFAQKVQDRIKLIKSHIEPMIAD